MSYSPDSSNNPDKEALFAYLEQQHGEETAGAIEIKPLDAYAFNASDLTWSDGIHTYNTEGFIKQHEEELPGLSKKLADIEAVKYDPGSGLWPAVGELVALLPEHHVVRYLHETQLHHYPGTLTLKDFPELSKTCRHFINGYDDRRPEHNEELLLTILIYQKMMGWYRLAMSDEARHETEISQWTGKKIEYYKSLGPEAKRQNKLLLEKRTLLFLHGLVKDLHIMLSPTADISPLMDIAIYRLKNLREDTLITSDDRARVEYSLKVGIQIRDILRALSE